MTVDKHRFRQEHPQFLESLMFRSHPVRPEPQKAFVCQKDIQTLSIQNRFDRLDVKRLDPSIKRGLPFATASVPMAAARMKLLLSPKNAVALGCKAHIVNPVSGSDGSGWQPGEE